MPLSLNSRLHAIRNSLNQIASGIKWSVQISDLNPQLKQGRQRQGGPGARKIFHRNPRILLSIPLLWFLLFSLKFRWLQRLLLNETMDVSSWNVGHVLKTAWKWSSWSLIWEQDGTNVSFNLNFNYFSYSRALLSSFSLILFCQSCRRRPRLFSFYSAGPSLRQFRKNKVWTFSWCLVYSEWSWTLARRDSNLEEKPDQQGTFSNSQNKCWIYQRAKTCVFLLFLEEVTSFISKKIEECPWTQMDR